MGFSLILYFVSPAKLSQKPPEGSKYQLDIGSLRKLKQAEGCIVPVGYADR